MKIFDGLNIIQSDDFNYSLDIIIRDVAIESPEMSNILTLTSIGHYIFVIRTSKRNNRPVLKMTEKLENAILGIFKKKKLFPFDQSQLEPTSVHKRDMRIYNACSAHSYRYTMLNNIFFVATRLMCSELLSYVRCMVK